jgi:hypothetical protein
VNAPTRKIEHPVLGPFATESWEWRARGKIAIPCLDGRKFDVSIVAPEDGDEPVPAQFDAILHLVQAPLSCREEFSAAMLRAYSEHIRPDYLGIMKEVPDSGISARQLPELHAPEDIWGRIKAPEYLWVNLDASVHVSFKTRFDAEHSLNVRLANGVIERVFME